MFSISNPGNSLALGESLSPDPGPSSAPLWYQNTERQHSGRLWELWGCGQETINKECIHFQGQDPTNGPRNIYGVGFCYFVGGGVGNLYRIWEFVVAVSLCASKLLQKRLDLPQGSQATFSAP